MPNELTEGDVTAFLALAESLRQMRGTTKAFESARDRYETACRTLAPLLARYWQEQEQRPDGETPIGPAYPTWEAYALALEAEQERVATIELRLHDKIFGLEKALTNVRVNDAKEWLAALKERDGIVERAEAAEAEVARLTADNARLDRLWAMNVERSIELRMFLAANRHYGILDEMNRLELEITE